MIQKSGFIIVLALLLGQLGAAQRSPDFGTWSGVAIETEPFRRFEIQASAQARTSANASILNQYFGQFGVEYTWLRFLESGVAIRHGESFDRVRTRIQLDNTFFVKTESAKFSLRIRLQRRWQQGTVDDVHRYQLGYRQKLGKKLNLALQYEQFFPLQTAFVMATQQRYTGQIDIKLSKRLTLNLGYLLNLDAYGDGAMQEHIFSSGLEVKL